MKKILFCFVLLLIFQACEKTPYTDRRQILLFGADKMTSLSEESYRDYMSTATLSNDTNSRNRIIGVGQRITTAVDKYLRDNNINHSFDWSFDLVADATVNAFCLPNGNIVFLEGILPVTQNDTGIAVVMGHEIAHAVAQHGNERMSQQIIGQSAVLISSILAGTLTDNAQLQEIWGVAVNLGTNLKLLQYSRKHELEADKLGLIFMAMAGYDPNEAVDFWTRMSEISGGSSLELLSTHPSDKRRIENIKEVLPDALKYRP